MLSGSRRLRAAVVGTGAVVAALAIAAGGWWWHSGRLPWRAASYVGQPVCGQCHQQAAERWRKSHHDLAMQPPTDVSVVGDFSNARFSYGGVTSTFSRRDGKFFVRTDGPDGTLHDYEVKYTFGVAPLQQYLDRAARRPPPGALHRVGLAPRRRRAGSAGSTSTRARTSTHRDELHWTGLQPELELHVRGVPLDGVRKHYDAEEPHLEYRLRRGQRRLRGLPRARLAPRRVGPQGRRLAASATAARRGSPSRCDDRRGVTWTIDAATGNAAGAHAAADRARDRGVRRGATRGAARFAEDDVHGPPLGDTHRVGLLDGPLYYADGQIRDEVYEYGSFLRAGCSPGRHLLATATSRTAASSARPGSQVA